MFRPESCTPGVLLTASADWTRPQQARAALEQRCRNAEAEADRLTRGICSLLLHDERGGRVAVPNLVRLLLDQPMPWLEVRP